MLCNRYQYQRQKDTHNGTCGGGGEVAEGTGTAGAIAGVVTEGGGGAAAGAATVTAVSSFFVSSMASGSSS